MRPHVGPEAVGTGSVETHEDKKFCDIGTGAPDIAAVLDALRKVIYEGWVMVESTNRDTDHVQSTKNMRTVLKGFGH